MSKGTKDEDGQQADQSTNDESTSETESKPYIARIVEPTPPPTAETEDAPKRLEIPEGEVAVTYLGRANVFTHGDHKFRHGEPVTVPSAVAEDLLSFPNEKFELTEPQQKE